MLIVLLAWATAAKASFHFGPKHSDKDTFPPLKNLANQCLITRECENTDVLHTYASLQMMMALVFQFPQT